MRKFYAVFFLLGFVWISDAQIIGFSDANFKEYLVSSYAGSGVASDNNYTDMAVDANGDGEIQLSEAAAVFHLRINGTERNITNVVGVEHFINLTSLEVYFSNITALDASPLTNLVYLNCNENQLASLNIDGLIHLRQLNCNENSIPSIDFNGLTAIESLSCRNNALTTVTIDGLVNLQQLLVANNNITTINVTNCPQLSSLGCIGNSISALEVNQFPNLADLSCDENLLTTLDVSALHNLTEFTFSNNPQLTYVNMKNGSNQFQDNVAGLPNLRYVCADESEISDVQRAFDNHHLTVNINSYCSFFPGGVYYTVHGNSRFDADSNGCGMNDPGFPYLRLSVTDGTNRADFIPGNDGSYFIPVAAGTHTLTPVLENPAYFNVSPSNVQLAFPAQTSPLAQNFCITPNGLYQDVETWITPITVARPGFDSKYLIRFKNKGNVSVSGTIVFAFDDDYMDFVSATPTANSQSFSSLNWDYVDLLPFQTRQIEVTLNLNTPMENLPLNAGDIIKFSSTINPLAGDEYTTDNFNRLAQTVVNSLDPNDKLCVEGNTVEPDMIGKYVHYVIRFENTGTFAAENIVVKDSIDTNKFDIASLVPLEASHEFSTRITNGNTVEFIFENINLPFDDASNDGYVTFKIKTKPTLAVGDSFSNAAGIYFDYNFPVVTDTFTTVIQEALDTHDFDFNSYFNLYPNPVKNVLNIEPAKALTIHSVSIYNMLGQLIQVNANPTAALDVSVLKSGHYIITITTDKGKASGRFIKN